MAALDMDFDLADQDFPTINEALNLANGRKRSRLGATEFRKSFAQIVQDKVTEDNTPKLVQQRLDSSIEELIASNMEVLSMGLMKPLDTRSQGC